MDALDLHVEHRNRIDQHADFLLDDLAQPNLVAELHLGEALLKVGGIGEAFQLAQFLEIGDPGLADGFAEQPRQRGIGLQQPAPRRHAVGLVAESLRPKLGEFRDQRRAQQVGMQGGDAIHGVGADDGQVRHAHLLLESLFDDGHLSQLLAINPGNAGEPAQEAMIDAEDDLRMPRQHMFQQRQAPLLQGFRQQRVVGVGQSLARQLPGVIPLQPVIVDQDPHQLGDRQRRMSVVHLYGDLVAELIEVVVLAQVAADDVPHGASHQEIFLHQPQLFAGNHGVGRIEDAGDVFGPDLLFDGADVVAAVEDLYIEIFRSAGGEQAQEVDGFSVVAGHRHVVGNAENDLVVRPFLTIVDFGIAQRVHPPIQGNQDGLLRTRDFKGRSVGLPAVGLLALKAVYDLLLEESELVVDAVAVTRHSHGGHGFQEAGGQPPQAAIAQAGIRLALQHFVEVAAQTLQGLAGNVGQAKIAKRIAQQAAHQEFHRKIVEPLGAGAPVTGFGLQHAIDELVAHGQGNRDHEFAGRKLLFSAHECVAHVAGDCLPQDVNRFDLAFWTVSHTCLVRPRGPFHSCQTTTLPSATAAQPVERTALY